MAGILQKTQHFFSNDSYIFVVEKEKNINKFNVKNLSFDLSCKLDAFIGIELEKKRF